MAIHEMFIYLCVQNAAEALDFYARAFGAREKFRLSEAGGRIGHAEMEFDGATLMLSDEFPEYGIEAPPTVGGRRSPSIYMSTTPTRWSSGRQKRAPASRWPPPISSTGNDPESCATPSAIVGTSVTASKRYHRKRCKSATTIWWPREAGNGAWPSAKGSAAGLSHRPGRLDAKWLAAVARHPKAPMAMTRRETRRRGGGGGDEDGYVQPRSWATRPERRPGSYDVGVPSPVSSETRLDVSQCSSATSWSMPQSQFQVRMRRTRSR